MTDPVRLGRALALAPLLSCATLAAWSQAPAGDPASGQATGNGVTLPGTVVERNVFVPVDSSGHTGGEYIVVERRVVAREGAAPTEIPTHFILVPQDGDDDGSTDSGDGDDEAVKPR